MYIKVLFFCIQNALKFTYSDLEFPNFPGEAEDPRTLFFIPGSTYKRSFVNWCMFDLQ